MKNIITAFAIFTSALAACQSNSTKTTLPDAEVSKTGDSLKHCYQYIMGKDSALLSLETKENQVTGTLTYNLFEKDKNNGVISGSSRGYDYCRL